MRYLLSITQEHKALIYKTNIVVMPLVIEMVGFETMNQLFGNC